MKNFGYFYSILGLPASNWQVNFDFQESGANPVPSVPSGSPQYSGILSNLNGFYSNSGSGHFISGANIQISNVSGLNTNYFTAFFVYHKTVQPNGILFSSLQSGAAYVSGFIVGVNDSNRLYLETYDNTGPCTYTSSNIYGSKNAVAVVKSNNLLKFEYFNFNSQECESEQFNISNTALYKSNQAYLGAPINAPSYINQNSFTGYMDQFIYVNAALSTNTINSLFSGLYASKNPSTTGVVVTTNNFITGGSVVLTGVGTGITGWNTYLAGTILDNCGNASPLYSYNNLTGTIYQDVFIPIGQVTSYTITGITDNGYFIDTGFCNTFGMEGFSYLRYNTGDFSEVYNYSQLNITGINKVAIYNLNKTFALDTLYTNNQNELYVNGISNIPSGYSLSGTIYQSSIVLSGDYIVSGQSIISNGTYQSTDVVTYDNTSGIKELFYLNTTTGQNFTSNNVNNRIVFLNGQKLVSGVDYNFTSSNLNILNTLATGLITNFPILSGFNYFTGRYNSQLFSKFSRDTTEVWMNGQKQLLNNDYVEISNVDLLSGSGIFQIFNNILYNGSYNFLEKF